jgi:hypothetical protein
MEITTDGFQVTVTGTVVKYTEYEQLKGVISDVLCMNGNRIEIIFDDAATINSALIGYLIRVKMMNNAELTIKVENPKLYDMLKTLAITDVMKVEKA